MTYKEAIDAIQLDGIEITATAPRMLAFSEGLKKAEEALEKAKKYRWHDLRKDSNDLPPNGYYDTSAYWHERYQNTRAFYNADKNKWYFHPDNNTGKPWVEDLSIIAWKEIESFEVEE